MEFLLEQKLPFKVVSKKLRNTIPFSLGDYLWEYPKKFRTSPYYGTNCKIQGATKVQGQEPFN